jgi:peptidoglycan/xylan/chitin deacetylase (PgdA/CDA1 family)
MRSFDRGVFALSLDFELIWGALDLFGPERFRRACTIERNEVIPRLLDLLVEFQIPATWCVVGHLFLESCDGGKHAEVLSPTHDWFEQDRGGNEETAPLFFARSLIEKIRACPVRQEIGCHSFSHMIFGDRNCSAEAARSELAASVRAAREMGIELRSFAFPRNQVGHLQALSEHGFVCYRGPEPVWYEQINLPPAIKRLAHLCSVLVAAQPPVSLPEMTEAGLWNIPGSMIYFPMHGLRRHIPVQMRVRRAIKGLEAAAARKRIFHMWFHPTNLADRIEPMFHGLREIFARARTMRERGQIDILTMSQIASRAESHRHGSIRDGKGAWSDQ